MVAGILLVHYAILREVLVRHEIPRGAYLVVLAPVVLMVPWPRYRRPISLAIAAVLTVSYLSTYPQSPGDIWAPKAHATEMADQFEAALDQDELDRLVADGRTAIEQSETPVPPSVIEAVRGRCVHAEPVEVAAIWANDLDWCPLPAFQSYSAYTSRLDEINAGSLRRPREGAGRRHPRRLRDRLPPPRLGVAEGDAGAALQLQERRRVDDRVARARAGARSLWGAAPGGDPRGRARRSDRAAPDPRRRRPAWPTCTVCRSRASSG